MSTLSMQAAGSKYVNNTHFDTGSDTPIGVESRCSGYISNIMDGFICPLVECNITIKGFGDTSTVGVKIGTIKWEWLDKNGKRHKFLILK